MNEYFLSGFAAHNRDLWDQQSADYQAKHREQLAASGGAAWGVWQLPESQLRVLGDVCDRDVLELGCGAAQWSIALHGLGARVTALDNSASQLAHARALMAAAATDFRLVHASAESTGLADASFDIIFCDHGAMAFGDPYQTIPEVARLLRIGGLLAFSMHTPILDLTWARGCDHPGACLVRNYWDLHAIEEPGDPIVFQLPYGTWIKLFCQNGFVIEDLIELRPPEGATSSYCNDQDLEWARQWPMEHIWRVRKTIALGTVR
jgi:SAM-dependent methyltransferase